MGDVTRLVEQARELLRNWRDEAPVHVRRAAPLLAALADAVEQLQTEAKRLRAEVGVARGERTAARARVAALEGAARRLIDRAPDEFSREALAAAFTLADVLAQDRALLGSGEGDPDVSESLTARALAASKRAEEERARRRHESAKRAERERQERAERHYREHVAPVLSDRLGTDPDEWIIAQHEPGVMTNHSMIVTHRDDPNLALSVFDRANHVRLAYQSDDGRWHTWNSGPLIRSLQDLGDALRQWERRNDAVEFDAS